MVRIIAFFIGLGFAGVLMVSMVSNLITTFQEPPKPTAEEVFHAKLRPANLPSDGPLGTFDERQLQRGFQVYKEVCAACHGLNLVAFYHLEDLGYNQAEIAAIAEQWAIPVPSINPDTGEAATRQALPSDRMPSPYPNETAARAANNNALPPDLSLITKARAGGADYTYSLLTGYRRQPAELVRRFPEARTGEGLYYNPTFHSLNIAMPPPFVEGQLSYADGTRATVDQMARDVTAFLVWAAEPNLQRRHAAGMAVVIFLLFATVIGYFAYRNIWATEKRKVRVAGALDPENQAKSDRAKREEGIEG